MPERNHLYTANAYSKVGSTSITFGLPNVLGVRQYILGLNQGRYVPGVYRCNGNTIFTCHGSCEDTMIPMQTIFGQKVSGGGAIAAYACGMATRPSMGNLAPAWDSILEKEALNKSYSKITASDLDVGVMIGELRETVEGLRNPLSSLREELNWLSRNRNKLLNLDDALQRASRSSTYNRIHDSIVRIERAVAAGAVPRSAKALANTWLEWRYGIRPLVKTVQDVIEHLTTQQRVFENRLQKRKGKTAKTTSVVTGSGSTAGGHFSDIQYSYRQTTTRWTVASTGFLMPSPLTWQARYGLDGPSIPGIAWELLPLSFVADWFVNVGVWLAALRVVSSPAQLLGTSISQRDDVTYEGWIDYIKYGSTKVQLASNGSYDWSLQCLQRKCLGPGFNAFTPSLNSKALNFQQQLDALALSWQRLPNINKLLRR